MIIVIDNYDSFTYNIVQALLKLSRAYRSLSKRCYHNKRNRKENPQL